MKWSHAVSKIIFVATLVLIAGACVKSKSRNNPQVPINPPASNEISTPAPAGGAPLLTIESFYSIAGLSYGDSFDKALAVLGSPSSTLDEPASPIVTANFRSPSASSSNAIQISYWRKNRALNSIFLAGNVKQFLKTKNIDDNHLQVFTMKYSDVVAYFGAASVSNDPVYGYEYTKAGRGRVQVNFWCVGDSTANCSAIQAIWNGTDSL